MRLVGHGKGDIDVTALAPQILFGVTHPLILSMDGVMLAEDLYFLGFPYGLETKENINSDFPLPLVKRATLSSVQAGEPMLLDGHNNFGFSGGPVARRGTEGKQTVIGVISGYRADYQDILDEKGKKTSLMYETNTGIIIAHDIQHAVKIVENNPIGVAVNCSS